MQKETFQLRVSKDGRLIVPRPIVADAGYMPHDFVEFQTACLRQAGMHRRTVLKLGFVGGVIATIADFVAIGSFVRDEHRRMVDTDDKVLARLFGARTNADVAVVPARHHPFWELADGAPGYEIETRCAAAYLRRFYGTSYKVEKVDGLPEIFPGNNVAAFGSQVSNVVTRDILGNPFASDIRTRVPVPVGSDNPTGSISLRWNLSSDPEAPSRVRRQYEVDWEYKPHMFLDLHRSKGVRPKDDKTSDLLLVTALPRDPATGARVVIFGGIHGAGTQAAELLLGSPPLQELYALEKTIGNAPHYQALFSVEVKDNRPIRVRLEEAQPLTWSRDPSPELVRLDRI